MSERMKMQVSAVKYMKPCVSYFEFELDDPDDRPNWDIVMGCTVVVLTDDEGNKWYIVARPIEVQTTTLSLRDGSPYETNVVCVNELREDVYDTPQEAMAAWLEEAEREVRHVIEIRDYIRSLMDSPPPDAAVASEL